MRRLLPILLCLLLAASGAPASAESLSNDPLFAWTLMPEGNGLTTPAAMATSTNGGVFVVGSTSSTEGLFGDALGGADGFILRISASGAIQWKQRLGGSLDDVFTNVLETPDGGCLALGTTTSTDGDARASRGAMDAWAVKLDINGELEWSKCLGGSLDDELFHVQLTDEGFIFACGRTQSRNGDLGANFGGWDAWAMLLNPEDGKPAWVYRYGFGGDDMFTTAFPIHEGWLMLGEIAEEISVDSEGNPVYIGRPMAQMISVNGEPMWEEPKILGDTGDNTLTCIVETETGWLLAGETNSRSALMPVMHGGTDIWVLHMRQSGTVSWQRTFGGSKNERLHSIQAMPGGGFLLLGETDSADGQVFGSHGDGDVWMVRITASGVLEWQQALGGSEDSTATGLLVTEEGEYLVAGTTSSQDGDIGRHLSVRTGFLAQLSKNGNILKTRTVTDAEECSLLRIASRDGTAYLLGSIRDVDSNGPTEMLWVSRLSLSGYLDH